MSKIKKFIEIIENDHKEVSRLAFDFIIVFSRFEFSLKKNEFLKEDRRKVKEPLEYPAEADWDRFFKDYHREIENEFNDFWEGALIFKVPPKKQIVKDGKLVWSNSNIAGTNCEKLKVYLKRIRNNLFHGGKYNIDNDDPFRNHNLLKEGLVVLEKLSKIGGISDDFHFDLNS